MSTLKKNILLLINCCCWFLFINTNVIAQEWPKIYGDNFHSLISNLNESYDKGFYLSGFIYAPYGFCRYIWIIKTDINGNILWDKKIGDITHQFWLSGSKNTLDNGIVYSGATTKYNSGDFDPLFAKLNVCGEIEWCKVLVCPDQNYGLDVISLEDDSFIGLLQYYGEGEAYARISLVKMDQYGEPIWIQKQAQEDSTIYNEEGSFLCQTSDDNLLVTGQCFHPGLQPFWIKTDTLGVQIWDLFWPGGMGAAYQLIEMGNDHFYSVGSFAGTSMPFTPTLFKFDNSGNSLNRMYILGDTIDGGEALSICPYTNSNILVGIIWGTDSDPVIYNSELFLLDTMGNILDRKLLLNEDTAPNCILKTYDDKILVTGYYVVDNNFDIYLWKMNSDLEDDTVYTQPLTYDSLCPYEIQSDTVYLDCGVFVNIDEIPTKEEYESTIKFSPNPARDWIILLLPENVSSGPVELIIYNLFGLEVMKTRINLQNRTISLNISYLSIGFYLAVCKDSRGRILSGKFIVSR